MLALSDKSRKVFWQNAVQQSVHLTLGTAASRRAARFASSSFLRLIIFPVGRLRRPRPSAGPRKALGSFH